MAETAKTKELVKAATKEPVKTIEKETKTPVKKAATKKTPAKKAELKVSAVVQFAGKSYSNDDLVKIAKDVWRHDLKKKVTELKSIELYIKPEEACVYYVLNDIEGSFSI
ncbi:MAG: DUF6465 family protein [Lachnospiraceae bacterium]